MTKQLPRLFVLIWFFFVFSSLILSVPVAGNAQEPSAGAQKVVTEEWDISADKVIRYEKPESIVAEGNIVLVKRKKMPPKPPGQDAVEGVTDWYILLEEAPPQEEIVTPESIETDQEPVYEEQVTIKADWMVYDADLGRVKARGNLLIDVGPDQLSAESGVVDLEDETGTFENATILRQYKDMHLEGRVVDHRLGTKTGNVKGVIEKGHFEKLFK